MEGTRGIGRPSRELTHDMTKWMQLDGETAMRMAEDSWMEEGDHQKGAPKATGNKKSIINEYLYRICLQLYDMYTRYI